MWSDYYFARSPGVSSVPLQWSVICGGTDPRGGTERLGGGLTVAGGEGLTPVAELDDGPERVVLDLPDDDHRELVGRQRTEQRLEVRRERAEYDLMCADGLRLVASADVDVRAVLLGQEAQQRPGKGGRVRRKPQVIQLRVRRRRGQSGHCLDRQSSLVFS